MGIRFWIFIFVVFAAAGRSRLAHSPRQLASPAATEIAAPQSCQDVEESFLLSILETVDQARQAVQSSLNCLLAGAQPLPPTAPCFRTTEALVQNLQTYRHRLKVIYTELAQSFIDRQTLSSTAESCFRDPAGAIAFDQNIRVLRIREQAASEATHPNNATCRGLQTSWSLQVDERAQQVFLGDGVDGMTADEGRDFLDSQASALGLALDTRAKFADALSEGELTTLLQQAHRRLLDDISALRLHLQNLRPAQLYQIYAFKTQYQQFLLNSPEFRQGQIHQCAIDNGYFSDCLFKRNGSRCFEMTKGAVQDVFPWVSTYFGVVGSERAKMARAASLMTAEESLRARVDSQMNALFGASFAGAAGAGKLASHIANKGLRAYQNEYREGFYKLVTKANIVVPQTTVGIFAHTVAYALKGDSPHLLREVARSPSLREIHSTVKQTNAVHRQYGVKHRIFTYGAWNTIQWFTKHTPEKVVYLQRVLAKIPESPLKMVPLTQTTRDGLRQRPKWIFSPKSFVREAQTFLQQQSPEGRRYLADFGQSLSDILAKNKEVKELLDAWRVSNSPKFRDPRVPKMTEEEFLSQFYNRLIKALEEAHPSLRATAPPGPWPDVFGSRLRYFSRHTESRSLAAAIATIIAAH